MWLICNLFIFVFCEHEKQIKWLVSQRFWASFQLQAAVMHLHLKPQKNHCHQQACNCHSHKRKQKKLKAEAVHSLWPPIFCKMKHSPALVKQGPHPVTVLWTQLFEMGRRKHMRAWELHVIIAVGRMLTWRTAGNFLVLLSECFQNKFFYLRMFFASPLTLLLPTFLPFHKAPQADHVINRLFTPCL